MTTTPQEFKQLTKRAIALSYDFGVLEAKRPAPTPVAEAHLTVYKVLDQVELVRALPLAKQGQLLVTVQDAYLTGLDKGRKLEGFR